MDDPPSPVASDLSCKSERSMEPPNNFDKGLSVFDSRRIDRSRPPSPTTSYTSLRTDCANETAMESTLPKRRREVQDEDASYVIYEQKKRITELEKKNRELKNFSKALEQNNCELKAVCEEKRLLNTTGGRLKMVLMREECAQEPALGRPIHPGMLYDCRSESFTSVPLWDSDAITKGTVSQSHTTVDTQVITKQSLKNRCLAFGMKKRMRTSFLSGMVEVGGAGHYLSHNTIEFGGGNPRASEYNCVTLHYKKTARVDQLCPSLLEKVTRPEVIRQQTATHVVMAVTYGTQAFLVFQGDDVADPSDDQTSALASEVQRWVPFCSAMAEDGAGPLPDSPRFIRPCAFYGDHGPPRVITDSKEAVDLCRSLHGVMGPDGEKAVPLTVWLYPLSKLDPAAAYVRAISADLQTRLEEALEACALNALRCESMKTDESKHHAGGGKCSLAVKLNREIEQISGDLQHSRSIVKTVVVTLRSKIYEERFLTRELDKLSSVNESVKSVIASHDSYVQASSDVD